MKRKGFTLVEVLAVVVIMGIILVIAVPKITKVVSNSKSKVAIEGAREITKASKMYSLEHSYFESIDVLDSSKLKYDGTQPTSGIVQTNSNGDTRLSVIINNYCVTKNYNTNYSATLLNDGDTCDGPFGITVTLNANGGVLSNNTLIFEEDSEFGISPTSST